MIETTLVIAVILGLIEVIKRAFDLPTRFIPLFSIILGVSIVLLFSKDFVLADGIFAGILAGLSSSGLYDFGKKTVLNK